ncbi:hypothetical protein ACWD5F_32955 [Streptomyces sp. NPDC002499]
MSISRCTFGALAAAALSAGSVALTAPAEARSGPLQPVARSEGMVWNAVAVDRGRIFVAGPRWAGSAGPALGLVTADGGVVPYPDPV